VQQRCFESGAQSQCPPFRLLIRGTSRVSLRLFEADGKAVAYPIRENEVDNIWVQPLDGSRGRQITNFDSEQILNFRWSPDGKSLCILRGHTDSDVVLFQESNR